MSNKSTVNQGSNGQYRTTVPKDLGDAFDLDSKQIEWSVQSGSALRVTILDDD